MHAVVVDRPVEFRPLVPPLADPEQAAEHEPPIFPPRPDDAIAADPLVRVMDAMRMSAIVVTRDARAVYVNAAGRDVLRGESGIALRGTRVTVTSPEARRRFATALAHACRSPWTDGALMLQPMQGPRIAQPLRVVAMRRFEHAYRPRTPVADEPHALLCIGAPRAAPPETALLQQLFGLTAAEAALMSAVAGGERLHACAARRGVSLATVRAQLRNVFVKTGAATQAELTTIAWSIPGLWIG